MNSVPNSFFYDQGLSRTDKRRPARPFPLALSALLLSFAAPSAAEEWPQWRGPNRDGVAAAGPKLRNALPDTGLRPLWRVDDLPNLRSGGWSSPIVAEGRVYVFTHKRFPLTGQKLGRVKFPYLPPEKRTGMSDAEYAEYEKNRRDEQEARSRAYRFDESLYCLNADTGELVWTNQRSSVYTRFSQSGTPAWRDGRLFVLGAGRVARCIDAQGKSVWETRLEGDFRDEYLQSSFVVAGDIAVVRCGRLYALDADSGKILWTAGEETSGASHSSPIITRQGDRAVVVANLNGTHTVGFKLSDGSELWRVESGGGHSTPLIVGNSLITYGSSRKRGLRCYDLGESPPAEKWVYQGAADPGSSPVAYGDHVYVQGDRRLACVHLETGKAEWTGRLDLNRPRYTSLIAADEKIFYAFDGLLCFQATPDRFTPLMQAVVDRQGLLAEEASFRKKLGIDALERTAEGQREAEQLWNKEIGRSGPLPCSTPAISNGRLYVRLNNSLACYDLSQP